MVLFDERNFFYPTQLLNQQGSSQASFWFLTCVMLKHIGSNGWLMRTDFTQLYNLSNSSTPLIRQMQQQQREDIAWLEGLRQHHQDRQLGHKQVTLLPAFQAEKPHCCRLSWRKFIMLALLPVSVAASPLPHNRGISVSHSDLLKD